MPVRQNREERPTNATDLVFLAYEWDTTDALDTLARDAAELKDSVESLLVNLVDGFVTSVEWTLATCKWAHAAQNRFESVMHEHQVVFSMLTTPEERLCVI